MLKMSPVKFFIYCALIFGTILLVLIPPFQSPDEDSHFKRAYVVSYGKFYPTTQDGKVGFNLPNKMVDYINDKLTFIGDRDRKYSYNELVCDDRIPVEYSESSFQNFSTVETTPVVYAAPALGIVFSRCVSHIIGLKNISIVNMLYFARFFSLILYIILVGLAIKTTPILKKTFCLIGLIPMSLSLAAAISYDSVLIGITLLSTALIFKLIFDDNVKKITYKYAVALGIMGFILLSVKTVYITALLPLIFIPKEKFGDKPVKNIFKNLAIMAGIVLGIYAINKIPSLFLKETTSDDSIAAMQQLQMVIQHPIYYIKIWINTMLGGRNYYYTGMFGIFGLSDTFMVTAVTVMYSIVFTFIVLSDVSLEEKKFNWKYKIVAILGIIASIFGIFLAMYLFWTSIMEGYGIGAESITGVQGRYFLPLIPIAITLLSNKVLVKSAKVKTFLSKVLENSYVVSSVILTISCITILLRFWCN